MIQIEEEPTDDRAYVEKVRRLINGAVDYCTPESVSIVRLDGWFGPRWLGFSHKCLGAFGVSTIAGQLVVPPFVPNRVTGQRSYRRVDSVLISVTDEQPLHRSQTSEANRYRKIIKYHSNHAFFWWSGTSDSSDRGAVMAYLPTPYAHINWYAGLVRKGEWRWSHCKQITRGQVEALEVRAAQPAAGADGL
jgi:hypothetical protein